jgi:hypothetical protein
VLLVSPGDRDPAGAARLRRAGHVVEVLSEPNVNTMRALAARPPEAFVIDLSRRPSMGRDAGTHFRQRVATRLVPIVFVGGEPDKVARVRELLPDAAYTDWRRVSQALERALADPPATVVVRGIFDAYSGTPLARKLGIREGSEVLLLGSPAGFEDLLAPLPSGVRVRRRGTGPADVIVAFAPRRSDLDKRLPPAERALPPAKGVLWIAWPKKTSGMASDLDFGRVQSRGLAIGLVDYKVCAIDQRWSGLGFARRRPT